MIYSSRVPVLINIMIGPFYYLLHHRDRKMIERVLSLLTFYALN